jgi:hypothetical protein
MVSHSIALHAAGTLIDMDRHAFRASEHAPQAYSACVRQTSVPKLLRRLLWCVVCAGACIMSVASFEVIQESVSVLVTALQTGEPAVDLRQ